MDIKDPTTSSTVYKDATVSSKHPVTTTSLVQPSSSDGYDIANYIIMSISALIIIFLVIKRFNFTYKILVIYIIIILINIIFIIIDLLVKKKFILKMDIPHIILIILSCLFIFINSKYKNITQL